VDDPVAGQPFRPAPKHKIIHWEPPPHGSVKLNFDGSVQGTSAAGGFIIRDWQGTLLRAGSYRYGNASVIMAEARALRDGMLTAVRAGYTNIIIEGDNQAIFKALSGSAPIPWRIANIIRDVRFMLSQCPHVEMRHIFREANMAADWLAKYGHTHQIIIEDSNSLHQELRKVVWDDMTGRVFVRKNV